VRLQRHNYWEEIDLIEPEKVSYHGHMHAGERYTFRLYRGHYYLNHFPLVIECEANELDDVMGFVNSESMLDLEEVIDFDREEKIVGDIDMYQKILIDETFEKLFLLYTRKLKMEKAC
jgi:hypothetical protein